MTFGEIDGPLPPISSWVYYMVHPDVPGEFDGCALHHNLTQQDTFGRGGPFRYEFFFLPGATVEECHAHYLGEMKARGTIWRQIRKVNRALKLKKEESGEQEEEEKSEQEDEDSETEGINSDEERHECYEMVYDSDSDQDSTAENQLPGLVWPKYDGDDACYVGYRGWLFMYHDADTDCSGAKAEKRAVSLVTFDPIPYPYEEDGVSDEKNPMKNPICSQLMPVRQECLGSHYLGGWMYDRLRANWEEEANEATYEARKMGWTSW